MFDIHCHLMPGVDDGSVDLKETIAMFKNAHDHGITDMILTPHYIKGTKYNINNDAKSKITDILREALRRAELNINIHYGNEAYIDHKMIELIEDGEVSTLGQTKYLLVELPVVAMDRNAGNLFFELIAKGYTPVIAHPERYHYFQKEPTLIEEYLKLGCLLQGNYMSLFGKYGAKAKKTLKTLLKQGKISFLCSDIHHAYHDYRLAEAKKKVLKIVKNADKVNDLFYNNAKRLIDNTEVINADRNQSSTKN